MNPQESLGGSVAAMELEREPLERCGDPIRVRLRRAPRGPWRKGGKGLHGTTSRRGGVTTGKENERGRRELFGQGDQRQAGLLRRWPEREDDEPRGHLRGG